MKYLKLFEDFDFDPIELEEDEYLYVKSSQIENAGSGLFTSIDIEKDEIISKFIGEIISEEESKKRAESGDDDYFMNLPSGEILDCKRTKCFAKYANDAEGLPTKFKNNAIISMDDEDNVVLVAKRDIDSNEEIFVGYGKNYWNNHLKRFM
jgi:SET domain-containing protein